MHLIMVLYQPSHARSHFDFSPKTCIIIQVCDGGDRDHYSAYHRFLALSDRDAGDGAMLMLLCPHAREARPGNSSNNK